MAAYPIWNQITACIYKSDKSYGVRETGEVNVLVGTSNNNSHHFVKHSTTHRKMDDGSREYRFYVDDVCIKRARLAKNSHQLEWLDPTAAPMNKENLMAPMSGEEYAQLCDTVGALAISQFNGNQEAYRQAIVEIFSVYAFGELDFRELTEPVG